MSKDVFWFKHDCNAHRDIKIRKIIHLYGFWGYGIFWAVIEVLREQDNYSWDKDDSSLQMLADVIGCKDDKKFISWYRDCIKFGLFEETPKQFCSNSLRDRMEVWETKKENGKKGGRPPKKNRTETEPITELKPDVNHKRREEERIEEKRLTRQEIESLIRNHKLTEAVILKEARRCLNHYAGKGQTVVNAYAMVDSWLLGNQKNGTEPDEQAVPRSQKPLRRD